MRIAIVGCGFVADYYMRTLSNYPELVVAGVMDRNSEAASRFAAFYRVPVYQSLGELLRDPGVSIVLNLTNPRSHFEVSKAILEAGKHVYSEKPLAMVFEEAEALVRLAESRGLHLISAPCSVLGETAQTIWKALRNNVIGPVRLVYAELDGGLLHRKNYKDWRSDSGAPWPYKDEFEVGCTMEHAGYYVTWFMAFFGPAISVTSFASTCIPDKHTDVPLDCVTPDFSVACIEFASGIVARLTCSIVAPRNHSLHIIGEEGVLAIQEGWDYGSPVHIQHRTTPRRGGLRYRLLHRLGVSTDEEYPPVRRTDFHHRYQNSSHQMDQARGVAELAAAIAEKRPCRMSTRFSLHCTEIALAIQYPRLLGCPRMLTTSFEPVDPMPWAKP
jgi:predicted dehydrogenase